MLVLGSKADRSKFFHTEGCEIAPPAPMLLDFFSPTEQVALSMQLNGSRYSSVLFLDIAWQSGNRHESKPYLGVC